ncbi:MAG TPA: SDR family NAD(P)-dependent oxidoreductase [Mycobacteriales bacterium]|nr:SDR family NAD(P)-dependent oxidoreductase [Mycobacteriales bacterium]
MSDATAAEVAEGVDLHGKVAVVTGVSAGLGIETVRVLRSRGADVVGTARDLDKARSALAGVSGVNLVEVDLADLDSVRRGASEILDRRPRIDLLVNNAGVMACPLGRTAQGFEMQLGTNHLGHFAFTTELLPSIGGGGRVVNLSSRGHLRSPMRWDDPHFRDESTYEKWTAYGQSKTANVLFAVGLEQRLSPRGAHAYAVHPGVIMTELSRHLSADDGAAVMTRLANITFKTVEQGAATTVWAATSPELEGRGGLYLEDCGVADVTPGDGSAGYAPYAVDLDEAERLWTWSEEQIS